VGVRRYAVASREAVERKLRATAGCRDCSGTLTLWYWSRVASSGDLLRTWLVMEQ